MSRPVAWIIPLVLGLLTASHFASASDTPSGVEGRQALERIRAAAAAHPDDPDLVWAHARRLAAEGRAEEAVARTREFLERWPTRRPGARVEIARVLLDTDQFPAAVRLLEEEIAYEPRSGSARFYRGLAMRNTGRLAEADREFELAARLEPALHVESTFARALGLFDLGRDDEAVELLVEILERDPTGDTATRARLMLHRRELIPSQDRFRADGYIGFEWDDNVTLESSENEVPASDREDFRGIWGVGASWHALAGERANLIVGYRYDQSEYDELDSFSLLNNTFFASGTWRATEKVALRLDGVASNTLQDLENELTTGSIRPSVLVSLGREWGAMRFFTKVEIAEYDDRPTFESWERDSVSYAVGLEHFLPLRIEDSFLSVSGSWERTRTQAAPSGSGDSFDGDYDYDSLRARALANLSLPFFDLRSRIEASYSHDRYHNDNISHSIATLGGVRKREDDILNGRIGISGPVVDHVRFEVYWRGTRRISNVDLFDYDKQVVGAVIRVSTN